MGRYGQSECPRCHEIFERKAFNQIYCSKRCQRSVHEARRKKRRRAGQQWKGTAGYTDKECPFCLEKFKTMHKDQVFCSKTCSGKEHNRRRYKKTSLNRKRKEGCSGRAKYTKGGQPGSYYSINRAQLLERAQMKRTASLSLYHRECKVCHEEFETRHSRKVCCTPECSGIYRKSGGKSYSSWITWSRDNFTCQYCGRNPIEDGVKLSIDHIKPRVDGGTDKLDNLVTACTDCNCHKNDRPLRHEAAFRRRLQRRGALPMQLVLPFMMTRMRDG